MTNPPESSSSPRPAAVTVRSQAWETASGYARNSLANRFVYVVVSPRTRGLSVGINLNPARDCNFDCIYCEVNRHQPIPEATFDVEVMTAELKQTLDLTLQGRLRDLPEFRSVPAELLQLRRVTFSGEGEPTLSPFFGTAVRAVAHLRALGRFPFFKIVVLTNATGLDKPAVRAGLESLSANDELWLKLDGGSQEYLDCINRPSVPIEKVLENILAVGRERPIIIQSLFPRLNGEDPPPAEIERYVDRLRELRVAGAQITLVQVYSAMRPGAHPECGHLSLRSLSTIAQAIRAGTGLTVEVF